MTDEQQRILTALHEASHCTMARLLEVPITGPSSIRPTEHLGGFAFTGRPIHIAERDRDAVAFLPTPLWPARKRRQIECAIMVALAGRMGETFVLGPSSRYLDDTDDRKALELADELMVKPKPSSLSLAERAMLSLAESGGPRKGDDEDARNLALLVGHDDAEAQAFLQWMRLMTARTMYTARRYREQVEALADELLEHEVVGSRRVRAVLDAAYAGDSGGLQVAARTKEER